MTSPPLEELPLRAQCGYIVTHSTVKQGELTPGVICGILHAKGLIDDHSIEGCKQIAAEVLEHHTDTKDQ